jgi:hypothetical protein
MGEKFFNKAVDEKGDGLDDILPSIQLQAKCM